MQLTPNYNLKKPEGIDPVESGKLQFRGKPLLYIFNIL